MQSREEPLQLKLDTCKSVFFKPTWVGCSSTSRFTFRNPSRLPLEFEWRISHPHRKMLAVQPAQGVIQPSESLVSAPPPGWGPRLPSACSPPPAKASTQGSLRGGLSAKRSKVIFTFTIISYSCPSGARLTGCTIPFKP